MDLKEILEKKISESKVLEYKAAENTLPKDFWRTYSSFGNTSGGTVILGIHQKNENDSLHLLGVNNPDKIITELYNAVNDPNKVSYNLISDENIKKHVIKDKQGIEKEIITVKINEAPIEKKPIYLNRDIRNSYKRQGDGDRKLTEDDIRYFVVNSKSEVDTELLTGYDMDDLNEDSIKRFKSLLIEASEKNRKYEDMDDKDFLTHLGVFKKERSSGIYKLTTGGLIFFGRYNSICDRFPKFQLDYFEKSESNYGVRWDDRVSTGDMLYPDLNMFDFYEIVNDKLNRTTKDEFRLDMKEGKRLPYKHGLQKALREALVNMLMHAYYDAAYPLKVTAYSDYYEFTNPGGMRITESEFIHGGNSNMRNSVIPTLFRRIGAAERAGSGGEIIFDFANKYGLISPELELLGESTTIRIWKIDLKYNIKSLNKNQQLIMDFVIENGEIRKKDAETLGLSNHVFRVTIKSLLEQKYLERYGNSSATKYILYRSSEENYYSYKKYLQEIESEIKKL